MHFTAAFVALASAIALGRAQEYTGDATYYETGVGACGFTNNDEQYVVAVSVDFYNDYPGATSNPNDNPICQHSLTANYNGNTVTAAIVDKCEGCSYYDIDLSPAAFEALAPLSEGRLDVTWSVN